MRPKAVQPETTFELYSIIFYSEKPHSILGLGLILACPLFNTRPVNLGPNPPLSISKHIKQINCNPRSKNQTHISVEDFIGFYWSRLVLYYLTSKKTDCD